VRRFSLHKTTPRYAFYEKVRVTSQASDKARVNGQMGAVLGRAQTENGTWYYTVHIYSTVTSWCFFEHELSPTGEQASREEFYDGSSVRVKVDEEGRGSIVSDE
jgi:hypothetical protein